MPPVLSLGNPAPLGLLAFGMTTMNLMYVEMGWAETDFEVSSKCVYSCCVVWIQKFGMRVLLLSKRGVI